MPAGAGEVVSSPFAKEPTVLLSTKGLGRGASKDLEALPLPPNLDAACANIEASVGGRQALIEHLAHLPLEKKQELLLGAIADPRNDELGLAKICQLYGIQFSQLVEMFSKAGAAKNSLESMQRVWKHAPDVAEDVMLRALPHHLPCEVCHGEKVLKSTVLKSGEGGKVEKVEAEEPCAACRGKGERLHQPEKGQQELALKLAGLIAAPGTAVQVNVSQKTAVGVGLGAGDGVFASFAAASDAVMYPGAAIEAEVVVPAAPPEKVVSAAEELEVTPSDLDAFEEEADEILGAEEP